MQGVRVSNVCFIFGLPSFEYVDACIHISVERLKHWVHIGATYALGVGLELTTPSIVSLL